MCTRVCGCSDCTSSRITRCDPASYGYDLGGAESIVADSVSGIRNSSGDFIRKRYTSSGRRAGGFLAVLYGDEEPDPTSLFPQVYVPSPDVGFVAGGVMPDITDRPREGPFDAHHDRQGSTTSPQLLQKIQGCLFRMTSYDAESDGPNFSLEHGVQLTDPRFLEYVGAPESARLMSRSPEYWVHHMGVENALSAALQLQHGAGLVLSNVQVLQQLVTSMCRTSSDVLLAVHGRQAFPSSAVQHVMPSSRVRRVAHYMMAMVLWRPPVETVIRTPMSSVACNACTSCQDCCPRVPRLNKK